MASMVRSRWAAFGAAVAVTLGAGGLLAVEAAGPPSAFVAVTPTRVLDTRAATNIGLAGPFRSGISRKLAITGAIATDAGVQTVVPVGATAVVYNVTVVGASDRGFVSLRPGNAAGVPTTSSINFSAGANVGNGGTVVLPLAGPNAGRVDIFFRGASAGATTHIVLDITGYYQEGTAGPPGPAGPTGPAGPAGPAGPTGVGFREDCDDTNWAEWDASTLTWECSSVLTARGTLPIALQGYGARITSDQYRGMFVSGASNWFDAYFAGNAGISTNGIVDRAAAARILVVNAGLTPIESGDVVAMVGVRSSIEGGQPVLGVASADALNREAVVGVATNAMSADVVRLEGGETYVDFLPSGNAAAPGDYLVVVTSGLAPDVKVESLGAFANVPIGRSVELSSDADLALAGVQDDRVVIGRIAGPVDQRKNTVPIFIGIDIP